MGKIYYIYKITNIKNNKVYIGMTNNYHGRIWQHKHALKNNNHFSLNLQNDYFKFGIDSLKFELLKTFDNKKEAYAMEKEYIIYYKNLNLSYNNNLGTNHSLESINKIRQNRKGKSLGKNNHFYGKTHKKETINQISKSRKGKCVGKDNPASRKVYVNGVIYDTVKDVLKASGLKRWKFKDILKENKSKNIYYID